MFRLTFYYYYYYFKFQFLICFFVRYGKVSNPLTLVLVHSIPRHKCNSGHLVAFFILYYIPPTLSFLLFYNFGRLLFISIVKPSVICTHLNICFHHILRRSTSPIIVKICLNGQYFYAESASFSYVPKFFCSKVDLISLR